MTSSGWPSPRGAFSRAGIVASIAVNSATARTFGDKEEEERSVALERFAVGFSVRSTEDGGPLSRRCQHHYGASAVRWFLANVTLNHKCRESDNSVSHFCARAMNEQSGPEDYPAKEQMVRRPFAVSG